MGQMIDLRKRVPIIRRAREYHLYSVTGKRYLDLWQNGGQALLGHRPGRLTTTLNGFQRSKGAIPGSTMPRSPSSTTARRAAGASSNFIATAPSSEPAGSRRGNELVSTSTISKGSVGLEASVPGK